MLRRVLRIVLPGGLLLGLVVLVRRSVTLRDEVDRLTPSRDAWTPIPLPDDGAVEQAEPRSPSPERDGSAWLAPEDDGSCPSTHPIKAKVSSGIYHLPGMLAYERTKPDRCYADETAASADGFTRAKR